MHYSSAEKLMLYNILIFTKARIKKIWKVKSFQFNKISNSVKTKILFFIKYQWKIIYQYYNNLSLYNNNLSEFLEYRMIIFRGEDDIILDRTDHYKFREISF